ncbi:hypothetical protein [Meridianimaribacter flavus]|uniref:Long-subunit fatty acid transport protein n=1 Tax=Meridianimaribacter flavus TaxID=571115 RepID=A0ABY2G963_9FLAO|nr:hypothetical protein [Meridianimaribacter flavus]TDY13951.1 long-subunit fatty acid transport protein [Meridianimaribacter flavus]
MIKRLVVVLITFFALQSHAQEGTASPYSFYGIGSLKFKGTVENRSMGGLSIYTDSIHINLRNPAGYAGNNLKIWNEESRPVKFTVGGSYSSTNLKSESQSDNTSTTTFDYFALSVPMGKFGLGMGLLPYTSVGYKLESNNDDGNINNRYTGEGGLNKAFLAIGYQITEDLSVGVDANYNFGNIQNNVAEYRYDDDGVLIQYATIEANRSDLSGLNFNIGVSYKTMVSNKLELISGLTYSPKSKIGSNNSRTFTAGTNTIESDLAAEGLDQTDLTLPSSFSFGVGIGQPRKWFLGAEYSSQNTSEFSNPIFSIDNTNFVNASSFSLGGFYIPNYDSFSGYWKRATYRAGMRFEHTGLKINNEDIREFGMSFGVGLPVGGMFSNANLGLEFGKRGTTNANLIQENFINFQLSLSLNDRWFQKIKYN